MLLREVLGNGMCHEEQPGFSADTPRNEKDNFGGLCLCLCHLSILYLNLSIKRELRILEATWNAICCLFAILLSLGVGIFIQSRTCVRNFVASSTFAFYS